MINAVENGLSQDSAKSSVPSIHEEKEYPSRMGGRNWVVVSTLAHQEAVALENLIRQGFDTYCPKIAKKVKHARYTKEVLRPLFPSYLFVRIRQDLQRWRLISSTFGVRAVIRCGERLSFLEDGFVAALKSREVDGAIAYPETPYRVGEQVQIEGGVFDGVVATIVEMNESQGLA
jgi:transcriptional antiterminator RfaH